MCLRQFACVGLVVFVSGCLGNGPVSEGEGNPVPSPTPISFAEARPSEAEARFRSVADEIAAVASKMCAENNPSLSAEQCVVTIRLSGSFFSAKNASHALANNGTPVITFNRSLLQATQNDDEIAFILSHEAAHQIGQHLTTGQNFAAAQGQSGAGFSLVLPNPKLLELEADAIGTIVAYQAGFDPLRGAQSIFRFSAFNGAETRTHPAAQTRFNLVQKTFNHLRAGHELTFR